MPASTQDAAAVRELFQRKAGQWSDKYRVTLRHRLTLFCDELAAMCPQRARVLDFGCGSGIYLCELASQGHRMAGIDFSPAMIEQCRRNLQEASQEAELHCGTLDDFPLHNVSFDAVICSSVIEYIAEPVAILKKLANLLSHDGVILMTVPNRHSWRKIRQRIAKSLLPLARPLEVIPKVRDHAEFLRLSNTYCPERIQELAVASELAVQKWFYFDPLRGARSTTDKRTGEMLFVAMRPFGTTNQRSCYVQRATSK